MMQFSLEDLEEILEMFDYINSDPAWRQGDWNPKLEAKVKKNIAIFKEDSIDTNS